MSDETVNLHNVNDGVHGRTGGPYLDQEQDRAEEVRRAKIEDREPDFENPLTSAGTVLVSEERLIQQHQATYHDVHEPKFDGEVTAPVLAVAPVAVEETEEVVDTSEETESAPDDSGLGLDL